VEQARDVERRSVSFHRRAGRYDDFFDGFVLDPRHELFELHRIGALPPEWCPQSVQHMIYAFEFPDSFDCDEVYWLFNDAEQRRVSSCATAYRALSLVAQEKTALTQSHLLRCCLKRFTE
jgi:hypothetical protein